jgi:hypothetical protein
MANSPLYPLESAIKSLLAWFRAERINGMIIGGVAASLLGRPRATRDVDALVWLDDLDDWGYLVSSSRTHGFEPRISDPVGFAQRSRVLLLRHVSSEIDIDVAIGALSFEEEAVMNAVDAKLGTLQVRIPRPEDLVIMKAIAHRPRDAADIEAVLEAHPNIDRSRIREYVEEFAKLLDQSDLLSDLDLLLKRVPGAAPSRKRQRRRPKP